MPDKEDPNIDWLKISISDLKKADERFEVKIDKFGDSINTLNNSITSLTGTIEHLDKEISGNGLKAKAKEIEGRVETLETANTVTIAKRKYIKWLLEVAKVVVAILGSLGVITVLKK